MNENLRNKNYPCFPYSQPGGTFYACSIPANEIIHRLEIRRRSNDHVYGIQREDDQKRVADIRDYLESSSAIIPTPIIVAADSDLVSINSNSLAFSQEAGSVGHILDGQHRVLGLRNLSSETVSKFDLLIVFAFDIDPYAQATIFSTVNSTQKQVSKSLMYDLFALSPGRSPEKSCHEIVKSLNEDETSPFFKRIKMLGRKTGDSETLSQAAFVDAVLRLIKEPSSIFREYYESDRDWVIRKVVSNAFNAAENAKENTKSNYPADYFFKTTGFGGYMQALGKLAKQGHDQNDMSQNFFQEIMRHFFISDPTPPTGTGNSAMIEVRERILRAAKDTL